MAYIRDFTVYQVNLQQYLQNLLSVQCRSYLLVQIESSILQSPIHYKSEDQMNI